MESRRGEAGDLAAVAISVAASERAEYSLTGLSTDFLKPVEAGQPFTVRVRRLPAPAPPSDRVREFHQLEYELTDVDGDGLPDILCGNYWIRSPARFDLRLDRDLLRGPVELPEAEAHGDRHDDQDDQRRPEADFHIAFPPMKT